MANSSPPVKRSYRSTVRSEKAQATRQAIVTAAGRLFAAHGYVATSVDDIASAAGVGRATIFQSVGGKADLLVEAYRSAVRGDEPDTPLGQQERSREILARRDPGTLLDGYAAVCVEFAPRLAPLYEAVRAAAQSEPEAAELWRRLGDERRFGAGRVIEALQGLDALPDGLDDAEAGDQLWVLNDPTLYHMLVAHRGWTPARFQRWLSRSMREQLI